MKIVHLSHSGFIVEDHGDLLIFDPITPLDLDPKGRNIYVFISHSHKDHFKWEVLEPLLEGDQVHFIVSGDVADAMPNDGIINLHRVDHYQKLRINDVAIEVYGTTDLGNSYLVSLHGKNYFHSGDLNWWHWKRMTPEELQVEEEIYKKEVAYLKGKPIHFAFVPVDPRLEEHGYLAANHFIQEVQPEYLIPMHSFGRYEYYKDLEDHLSLQDTKLIPVGHEGQGILRIN